jgi:hypothetical protein
MAFRRARDKRNHAFGLSIGHLTQMLLPGNDGDPDASSGRYTLIPPKTLGATADARNGAVSREADVSLG